MSEKNSNQEQAQPQYSGYQNYPGTKGVWENKRTSE